jgi:hypothetical protein
VKTKICSKCQENKNVSDFYKDKTRKDGYRSRCKICCNIESGEYQKLKPEISRKKSKTFREKHPTKVKEIYKKWRSNNISKEQKRSNEWKKNNRDKVNIYKKNIRNLDPVVKLVDNVRNRINQYIKHSNISKHNKTFDIVGCSPEFLKEYLEKQFTNGMSWELMGQHIHIDHIIPLSSAKTEEEVYKLCHYTNLQPLWAEDNLKKGSKIL